MLYETLLGYYTGRDYIGFFNSREFLTSTPEELGVEGIQICLNMLCAFFNDDAESVVLDDFHKLLILTRSSKELFTESFYEYGGTNDSIYRLAKDGAYVSLSQKELEKVFSRLQTKHTLSNNWKGLAERFWIAKSKLAEYFTFLYMLSFKYKIEDRVSFFFSMSEEDERIAGVCGMLKLYSEIVCGGEPHLSFSLKRKILGTCLEHNNIELFVRCYEYFDSDTIAEMQEVASYFSGDLELTSEHMLRWFGGEVGRPNVSMIINHYWYKHCSDGINGELIKALSGILYEYDEKFFSTIILNPTSAIGLSKEKKEAIFVDRFDHLVELCKSNRSTFPLVSYIYSKYIEQKDHEGYSHLRQMIKKQVTAQFSEELSSAEEIGLFKFDTETRVELQEMYCQSYASRAVNGFKTSEELEEYLSKCKERDLAFVLGWVNSNVSVQVSEEDQELYIRSLIQDHQYGEAIRFAKSKGVFSEEKRDELIFDALVRNFDHYGVDERAFRIFSGHITDKEAERIILSEASQNTFNSQSTVLRICLHIYRNEWVKAMYLFVPFKKITADLEGKFIDECERVLKLRGIVGGGKHLPKNHYGVMKIALRVLSSKEFDELIMWARSINIPRDANRYKVSFELFDHAIKGMLDGKDYRCQWEYLLTSALRNDTLKTQDSLRYSIIASFVGRYGIEAFDRAVQTVALSNKSGKEFTDIYISLWKGLLGGEYSANFLELSKNVIDHAPTTFWNVFYDVAACKNHVFSNQNFIYKEWCLSKCDMQSFYDMVLARYLTTRESVFLKIAVKILCESDCAILPSFEHYVSYVSSARDKDFIFSAIIKMVIDRKCIQAIESFLSLESWQCDGSEDTLRRILLCICRGDSSYFSKESTPFSREECIAFENDFLRCLDGYPDAFMTPGIYNDVRERSMAYQYKLMEMLILVNRRERIPYMKTLTESAPRISNSGQLEGELLCYLDLMSTLYKNQLGNNVDDLLRIQNRYYRLLAIELLLESDREGFSDENVIELMRKNKHSTGVIDEYTLFRKHLSKLMSMEDISEKLKAVFVMGLISSRWEQFFENITLYSKEALELVGKIERMTNYRDFNICALWQCICEHEPDEADYIGELEFCFAEMAYVLEQTKRIYKSDKNEYARLKKVLMGICYLENRDSPKYAYYNLKKHLEEDYGIMERHWELFMSALLSTSYVKTIVNILSREIRQKSIKLSTVKKFKAVFVRMGEETSFAYLLALGYALERNRSEARAAYNDIPNGESLPKEWKAEKEELERYVNNIIPSFDLTGNINVGTLSVETEASGVSFIGFFNGTEGQLASIEGRSVTQDSAYYAYNDIINGDIDDITKYSSYKDLFAYLKTSERLYDLYRRAGDNEKKQKSRGRLTYNELVIELGALAIEYEEGLTQDQKLDVLLELFEVYKLLSDVNKTKKEILSRLLEAKQGVLEIPGVSFEKWISSKDKIYEILQHPAVNASDEEAESFKELVETYSVLTEENTARTDLLSALEKQHGKSYRNREKLNLEYSFVVAVERRIHELRMGVNLSIEINRDRIEDSSVFYQVKNISPTNNVAVRLDNSLEGAAHLRVFVGRTEAELKECPEASFATALDLRPGDTCGQQYIIPQRFIEGLGDNEILIVSLSIEVDGIVICNNSKTVNKFVFEDYCALLTSDAMPAKRSYGTAVPAFSMGIKGFGRDSEKLDVFNCLCNNLAIIYGPSRAGKSSLMNRVAREYPMWEAIEEQNRPVSVMQIRIADELQGDAEDYYIKNIITGDAIESFESEEWIMEYLFLTPLRIAFSRSAETRSQRSQMCAVIGEDFDELAEKEILEVLDGFGSVSGKYNDIYKILSKYNYQIMLMYDEFQQVVQKWVGGVGELTKLCTFLRYKQDTEKQCGIKMVLCGSDELVRIFKCEKDAVWKDFQIKTAESTVFVGQMRKMDFCRMMNDRRVWVNLPESLPWGLCEDGEKQECVPAVLESLYEYTGGNAICGKLFGDVIIEKLRNGDYRNRKHLYPADITHIVYDVLSKETSEVMIRLISHTTKNLENEEPYLLFIAHELMTNVNRPTVSFKRISEFFAEKDSKEIEISMKMLEARGIIKQRGDREGYEFATLFYFDFYKKMATPEAYARLKDHSQPSKAKANESSTLSDPFNELVSKMSLDEKKRKHSELYDEIYKESKDYPNELRDKIGSNSYFSGDLVKGNKQSVTAYQNIQIINNTFVKLFSDAPIEEKLQAFNEMPKLENFYTEGDSARIIELTPAIEAINKKSEEGNEDLTSEELGVLSEVEGINTRAGNRYYGNLVSTMYTQSEMTPGMSMFSDVDDSDLKNILGINGFIQLSLIKALPKEYYRQLCFAVKLHKLIMPEGDEKPDYSDIDFSPITIMYCKLVEIMLKEIHLGMFGDALPDQCISSGVSFKELKSPDVKKKNWTDITIGTFVWHLIYANVKITSDGVNNRSCFTKPYRNDKKPFDKTVNLKKLSELTGNGTLEDWKQHAMALAEIAEIRNRSAHGGNAISKTVFDHLVKVLFEKDGGELLRIWSLNSGK